MHFKNLFSTAYFQPTQWEYYSTCIWCSHNCFLSELVNNLVNFRQSVLNLVKTRHVENLVNILPKIQHILRCNEFPGSQFWKDIPLNKMGGFIPSKFFPFWCNFLTSWIITVICLHTHYNSPLITLSEIMGCFSSNTNRRQQIFSVMKISSG